MRTARPCIVAATACASNTALRSIVETTVERPGTVWTRPDASSRASASRMGVRLMPNQFSSSGSRSFSPGANVPPMIASRMDTYA